MSLDAWNGNLQPAESSEHIFQEEKKHLGRFLRISHLDHFGDAHEGDRQGHTQSPQSCQALLPVTIFIFPEFINLSEIIKIDQINGSWMLLREQSSQELSLRGPWTASHRNHSSNRETQILLTHIPSLKPLSAAAPKRPKHSPKHLQESKFHSKSTFPAMPEQIQPQVAR